jgi:hypothetical protein
MNPDNCWHCSTFAQFYAGAPQGMATLKSHRMKQHGAGLPNQAGSTCPGSCLESVL